MTDTIWWQTDRADKQCCDIRNGIAVGQITVYRDGAWQGTADQTVCNCHFLTLRRLMSYIYIYGAPILDVSRSHTTTQHSR